jgi:hypothetical protein
MQIYIVIALAVLGLFSCDSKKSSDSNNELQVAGLRSGPDHLRWDYNKSELTRADLESYYHFVYRFGAAVRDGKCHSFKSCINNPEANLFYGEMPNEFRMSGEELAARYPDLKFEYEIDTATGERVQKISSHPIYADCGDLPKMLEGFHAFMKKLPFGIAGFPSLKAPAREYLKIMKRRIPGTSYLTQDIKEIYLAIVTDFQARYEADPENGENLLPEIQQVVKDYNDLVNAEVERFVRTDSNWQNLLLTNQLQYEKELGKAKKQATIFLDNRYASYGNKLKYNNRLIKKGDNALAVFQMISNTISTSSFRLDHHDDIYNNDARTFKDFYPVDLSRESLPPGSILYDPSGHIWVVFHVDADGVAHMIDAHPDDSITYKKSTDIIEKINKVYPAKFGGGFQALRPWRVSRDGRSMVGTPNHMLPHYSLVQSYGTENYDPRPETWSSNIEIIENGVVSQNLYQFGRRKLSRKPFQIDVLGDFRTQMNGLCTAFKERVDAVDKAVERGLHRESHPIVLPANIYQTEGDWENFSSPGRDARIRSSVRSVISTMKQAKEQILSGNTEMIYTGSNLYEDFLRIYNDVAYSCVDQYKNSNNRNVQISLNDFIGRIYDVSFDPYHCPELRWGAKGRELESCPEYRSRDKKMDWYTAQEFIRYTIDRDTSVDYSVPFSQFRGLNSQKLLSMRPMDLNIAGILNLEKQNHRYVSNRAITNGYIKPEEAYYNFAFTPGTPIRIDNGPLFTNNLVVSRLGCHRNVYGKRRYTLIEDNMIAIPTTGSWMENATYKDKKDCQDQIRRAQRNLKNDTICVGYTAGRNKEAYLIYNFKNYEFYSQVNNGQRQIMSFRNIRACERRAKTL